MSDAEYDAFLDHRFALDVLRAAADQLADPEYAYQRWFDLTVALLTHHQLPGYTTLEVVALAARVTARDVTACL